MKKFLVLFAAILLSPAFVFATTFLSEDWETGTPPACWPCEQLYCDDLFNGWYTDYGDVVEAAGVSTADKNSGSRSYYNPKEASNYSGCPITYEFDTPYPTTIYVRFYMKLTGNWSSYATSNQGDPLVHWVFTNSQAGSTGFRLNLVNSNHWGVCPTGDLCLLPEGDGGEEWWDSRATPAWSSAAANDYMQYVGAWHCFEFKMQISGSNMVLTEYIDGVQKRSSTGPGQNTSSFNKIIFHLWDNPAGTYTMAYYLDDIVVSDSYIGPISEADTTAPTVTAFTIPSTATSLTVAVSTFTATDAVGVTGYCVNESATAPTAATCSGSGWAASAQSSYVFSTEGAKTLYAWAKDAAGNISTSLNDGVTITLPPPANTGVTLHGVSKIDVTP